MKLTCSFVRKTLKLDIHASYEHAHWCNWWVL